MVEIDDHNAANNNNNNDSSQFHQTLTLALPIQLAATSTTPAATPATFDTWSDAATSALIDAWAHRYLDLGRGILKPHHWQEVAAAANAAAPSAAVSKSEIQCKQRIDALKKRYRSEKSKPSPSSWRFFHRLDRLLGANLKAPAPQFPQKMRTPTVTSSKKRPRSRSRSRSPEKRKEGVGVLMGAIARFGEMYERVERSRAERVVEMEKQRMGFVREVEMQRMQFVSELKLHLNLKWEGGGRRRR